MERNREGTVQLINGLKLDLDRMNKRAEGGEGGIAIIEDIRDTIMQIDELESTLATMDKHPESTTIGVLLHEYFDNAYELTRRQYNTLVALHELIPLTWHEDERRTFNGWMLSAIAAGLLAIAEAVELHKVFFPVGDCDE